MRVALGRYRGVSRRVTVEGLVDLTGVEGRTVRAILSALDGEAFVLGGDDTGVYVAEYVEDAERMTRRLESQARKMLERAARRRAKAAELPRRQGMMFPEGG